MGVDKRFRAIESAHLHTEAKERESDRFRWDEAGDVKEQDSGFAAGVPAPGRVEKRGARTRITAAEVLVAQRGTDAVRILPASEGVTLQDRLLLGRCSGREYQGESYNAVKERGDIHGKDESNQRRLWDGAMRV